MREAVDFRIISNKQIAKNTYEMVLQGSTEQFSAPGQFCNIMLEGCYLRRPISVCSYENDKLVLIYKTVGEGTKQMAGLTEGAVLNVLTGLGNGFDVDKCAAKTLVVGGGAGVPPMYGLAKRSQRYSDSTARTRCSMRSSSSSSESER